METIRPCGCKGIRSCLLCETEYKIIKPNLKAYFEVRLSKYRVNFNILVLYLIQILCFFFIEIQ